MNNSPMQIHDQIHSVTFHTTTDGISYEKFDDAIAHQARLNFLDWLSVEGASDIEEMCTRNELAKWLVAHRREVINFLRFQKGEYNE